MFKAFELKGIIERIVQFVLAGFSAWFVLRFAPNDHDCRPESVIRRRMRPLARWCADGRAWKAVLLR
jgi:hypothetical protein